MIVRLTERARPPWRPGEALLFDWQQGGRRAPLGPAAAARHRPQADRAGAFVALPMSRSRCTPTAAWYRT
jgi:hypothetical protein